MAPQQIFVDLTHTLMPSMQIYPGDPSFTCCPALTLPHDGVNVAQLGMGSHTGTHIDAPLHFFTTGAPIDRLPLSNFVGPAIIVDLTVKRPREQIEWADLEHVEGRVRARVRKGGETETVMLFLRTGWDRHWTDDGGRYLDHPFLAPYAAQKIIEMGVRVLGVDALSPDETPRPHAGSADPPAKTETEVEFAVHKTLLGAGVLIVENLTNLEALQVQEGEENEEAEWTVCLAPLKLGGCDGSPVRAFAWRRGEA